MYRLTRPLSLRARLAYSCAHSVRSVHSYSSLRLAALNPTSPLAPTNARICSKLNRSPFFMLISNPQHAVSLLQAHLALETHLPFRLIWRWKRLSLLGVAVGMVVGAGPAAGAPRAHAEGM